MTSGDLLILDEASLAGTFALDRLVAQARQAGAKILLVGDPAQLGAVGAGGAFGLLVGDRQYPPELTEARRFSQAGNGWPAPSSGPAPQAASMPTSATGGSPRGTGRGC